ncbi:MAG: peptide deformylase [Anaerolineales bacterium]|nr:peptide deformylase [Anaerolineales bacterium]
MALLEIITPSNPTLRKKAKRVSDFSNKKLQQLIDDMVFTMHEAVGVGLAAPQVDVGQRLIVIQLPDDEESREEYGDDAGVLFVVLNPEIVKASKEMVEGVEACLSLPGYFGKVNRHQQVLVKGFDRHGNPIRIKAKDWLARVFQHEIDHLDGVLFIDHATEIWRSRDVEPIAEIEEAEDEPATEPDVE